VSQTELAQAFEESQMCVEKYARWKKVSGIIS
jgi:hypothetical protein